MNEDPKYWEDVVLPWIKELKEKQEAARELMAKLEDIAYSKAGYTKVDKVYAKYTVSDDGQRLVKIL
jgi:hypothetical protein